tara:strand:- start:1329 stop:1535 length:207 start_codon:yes stop_codon:yes gene_type:complete
MNAPKLPLYESGNYWVSPVTVGKISGYAVYKAGITHSTRCATITLPTGAFERAKQECDRRASLDAVQS